MTIPAHPHRTHSSQRSRKRKRPYRPQSAAEARAKLIAQGVIKERTPQKAEKPVQPGGLFAFLRFLFSRWFK